LLRVSKQWKKGDREGRGSSGRLSHRVKKLLRTDSEGMARSAALVLVLLLCQALAYLGCEGFCAFPASRKVVARFPGCAAALRAAESASGRRARAPLAPALVAASRRVRSARRAAGLKAAVDGTDGFPSMGEMNPFARGSREAEMVDALMQSLQVEDAEQRQRIEQTPQGSQDWLDARKFRLTASNFGAAAGRNRFRSPKQLVQDMLYGEFKGNDATRWGSEKESVALGDYVDRKRSEFAADGLPKETFFVTQSGLHVCAEAGWLAASPDGHVNDGPEKGLLEIKCPYSRRIYPSIPDYYVDQVQGLCAILGYQWADFVVWTPEQMQVQRVDFDKRYWQDELRPALVTFYRDLFLPAYVEMRLAELDGADVRAAPPSAGKPAAVPAREETMLKGESGRGSKEVKGKPAAVPAVARGGTRATPEEKPAPQPANGGQIGRVRGPPAPAEHGQPLEGLPAAGQGGGGAPAAPALMSTIYMNAAPLLPPQRSLLRRAGGAGGGRGGSAAGKARGGVRSSVAGPDLSSQIGNGPALDSETQRRLVEVVREVEVELAKRERVLEFVGAGPDSFYVALARQLAAAGGGARVEGVGEGGVEAIDWEVDEAAHSLRRELLRHVAAHQRFYEGITGEIVTVS
jgi:putative phage-type endonuclease